VIDFRYFPSAVLFHFSQAIMLAICLTDFYISQRVHHGFVTHHWHAAQTRGLGI
jgi:hypothetical protein